MLKNRADKLVLKAFLELSCPEALVEDAEVQDRCYNQLRSLTNRLLMGRDEQIELPPRALLSKEDKASINALITRMPDCEAKRDFVFFYRLAVLVEQLLIKYSVKR